MEQKPQLLVALTTLYGEGTLIRGQLAYGRRLGYEVVLLSAPSQVAAQVAREEEAGLLEVPLEREIAPLRDIISLWRIVKLLRKVKPTVLNASTPKAGFLVTLAAWLCRVPCRIYTLRGLRLETASGLTYMVLKAAEKVSCRLADRVICISPSLRDRAIGLGLVRPDKTIVIHKGSSNGCDVVRYSPTDTTHAQGILLRQQLGIADRDVVIGFLGRVVCAKGIRELATAWKSLRGEFPTAHLLLVGPEEPGDSVPAVIMDELRSDPRVYAVGEVSNTVPYYAAMDLFVLPSYREGFGNVLIEAAAMKLPVISTRIPGCIDAVEDGVTGTLVPVRDAKALADAMRMYLNDPALRQSHGEAGRRRVVRDFRQEIIWKALHEEYHRLLQQKGWAKPAAPMILASD